MKTILITVVVASLFTVVAIAAFGAADAVRSIEKRNAQIEKTLEEAK